MVCRIIGNLGVAPELRTTNNGQPVTTLSVATHERWTSQDGVPNERTEWHRVTVFGKTAENCAKYLTKGRAVYVQGRLQTRHWEDKDGVSRHTTEIVADNVQFLGGPDGSRRTSESDELRGTTEMDASILDADVPVFTDEDVPF